MGTHILLQDVGEYTVVFNFDERYYESVPFKVTILPKTIELKPNKQFKYFGEQDPILENKSQQTKPEVTNQPSNDEKRKHYNQLMLRIQIKTNMQVLQIWNQIKIQKPKQIKTKVVTGVFNLTPMYLSFMTISLVVAMYILIKKRNVKI